MNAPSVKAFRTQLPNLRKLEPEQIDAVRRAIHDDWVGGALDRFNEYTDQHGVEYIASQQDNGYEALGLSYVNTGDPYHPTLIFDHARRRFYLSGWGDVVEQYPQRFQ